MHAPRPLLIAILLALAAEALFVTHLARPSTWVFDETHYVPAARALLLGEAPYNIEHPLFGKSLIALGILLFGDNAFGWRFFSSLAGAGVVVAVFVIGWQLFGRMRPALTAALLAMVNFTIYIQARIAMLDGFATALVLGSIVVLIAAGRSPHARRWLVLGGALLGLAIGVKWSAAPFLGFAVAAMVWRRRDTPWQSPIGSILMLIGTAMATYFATFAPAFFYRLNPLTLATLLPFQLTMWQQQTAVLAPHPYQSPWWSWPLDWRPIWYLYERVDGAQRGILMLGNPLVMWGGLAAVVPCLYAGIARQSRPMLAVALLWVGSSGIWALIPKKIGFFYYYYLPSILLCLVLAATLDFYAKGRWRWVNEAAVIAAFALFAWFFPILSAAPLDGPQAFQRWMWLDSWR